MELSEREENRKKLIKSYVNKDIVSEGKPNILIIESTNFCNLKCKMCPRRFMKREVGMMSFDLFKKIIDEGSCLEFVWMHLFGEALFNKNLVQMIEYAKEKGVKVGLSTNSKLLTQNNFDGLLLSGLDILIVNLYDDKQQDGEITVRDVDEIEGFLENKAESDTKIVVQKIKACVEPNLNEMIDRWGRFSNVIPYVKGFHSWADQIEEITEVGIDVVEKDESGEERLCLEPWRGFAVYWNGDCALCCNDYDGKVTVGNVNEESIDDVWNSEKMQDVRRKFVKNDYENPLCRSCFVPCADVSKKVNHFTPYEIEQLAYWIIDEDMNEIKK